MGCPILSLLPEVASVIARLQSGRPGFYLREIAENMCEECRNRTPDGECPMGEDFGRAVRRSLPQILDAMEKEA